MIFQLEKKGFFFIAESVFFFCINIIFVLYVALAFCSCLGPFGYCRNVEHTTAACCAVSHLSTKPTSGPDFSTHQWSRCAMSASTASPRITCLSFIKTAAVFWENWQWFYLIIHALGRYLHCTCYNHWNYSSLVCKPLSNQWLYYLV